MPRPCPGAGRAAGGGRRDAGPGWCPAPLATRSSLSQTADEPWACTDASPSSSSSSSSASVPQVGTSGLRRRGHALPEPGWGPRGGGRGTGSPRLPQVPGADPGMGRGAGGCLAGFGQGAGIAGASSGHCQGVLGASRGHLWGFPRALAGHTRQAGVTLSSLQGLSSEQQVRAGCPGPRCTQQGEPCPCGCLGAGAELPKHGWPSVGGTDWVRGWSPGCPASPA